MPGDVNDTRLNNYFLENIFKYYERTSDSLWHLGFFSPFPFVLGFSDNLFGAAPVYILARLITEESDTAFQYWYLFSYFANYAAAYYALKKLGLSSIAATTGALIFSFALPVTGHSPHSQLIYRFGIPLSAMSLILFLKNRNWKYLLVAGGWLTWQFYCTIYMGFFALLLMVSICFVYFYSSFKSNANSDYSRPLYFAKSAIQNPLKSKLIFSVLALFLLFLMIVLFYPYWRVTQMYGATREFSEIASMLPRPQSYFVADSSWIWSSDAKFFDLLPVRHEHQMFIGLLPMTLAIIGLLIGRKSRDGIQFRLMASALVVQIAITLSLGGVSLWYFFAQLPLASAIRAMTRIDLALLFPAAYLAGVAIDYIRSKSFWTLRAIMWVMIPAVIIEASSASIQFNTKQEWRDRLSALEVSLPKIIPPGAIVFFAQNKQPYYSAELDAMWVSLNHRIKTLNGYSGLLPHGMSTEYGDDCYEIPKRVNVYLELMKKPNDDAAFFNIIKRIIPVGFINCDAQWLVKRPQISTSPRVYTPAEIRQLAYAYEGKATLNGRTVVSVRLRNQGSLTLAAKSATKNPLLLSWRFLDEAGKPTSGWENRKSIPVDIMAGGDIRMSIPIDAKTEVQGGTLQVSLVQEGIFWAHENGLPPLVVPWK
jgi:hypothetical protein